MAATLGTGVVSAAHADMLTGHFTILNGAVVPSGGTVTFSLNGDGTIAASLVDTAGTNIEGFGFDSVAFNLPESNFAPTPPDNDFGWSDMYGVQPSGFLCSSCGTSETWTIGNPGDYSSVFQAVGGATSTHDFFMLDNAGGQWAGDIGASVPEPAAWMAMILGFGLLGVAARRRRSVAA
jgi:hypothetical protein